MTTLEAWVSPLVEVERAVQERAKATNLDPAAEGGRDRLRALIEDEVARWSEDYKRGLRDFDLADPSMVVERAFCNLAGYGPLEPLLADDDVWEIMVNGPEAVLSQSVSIFWREGRSLRSTAPAFRWSHHRPTNACLVKVSLLGTGGLPQQCRSG